MDRRPSRLTLTPPPISPPHSPPPISPRTHRRPSCRTITPPPISPRPRSTSAPPPASHPSSSFGYCSYVVAPPLPHLFTCRPPFLPPPRTSSWAPVGLQTRRWAVPSPRLPPLPTHVLTAIHRHHHPPTHPPTAHRHPLTSLLRPSRPPQRPPCVRHAPMVPAGRGALLCLDARLVLSLVAAFPSRPAAVFSQAAGEAACPPRHMNFCVHK